MKSEVPFVVWSACYYLAHMIFAVCRMGMKILDGLGEREEAASYNDSRAASNVRVLFTYFFGRMVWRSKGMD